IYHDFRGKPLPAELVVFQAQGDVIKEEASGLRITIPDTWQHPFGGVGVKSTFGLRGDFEVTTTFEILKADIPEKMGSYGVGICLRVVKAEPTKEIAQWCRLVRPGGRQLLHWERQVYVEEGKYNHPQASIPCEDKVGRLRMKRIDMTLQYLWAPGLEGGDFKLL